ncbi:sigma-70 family RNA polymerase sigma factor [Chungangia koreensis]|uniref:Sigma-70 family RNA polymerase sigma factor n=1 Tax=Chungangia koreensis TaxID=752657 RepID=A0ABV8X8T2_9LACT
MEIEEIYITYVNDLYRYLFSLTKHHAEAEDLLQETFTKAYIALLTSDIKEIKPWLFKVGYYTYIDRYRKEKQVAPKEDFDMIDLKTPETVVMENDSFQRLLLYLDRIKQIEKQAILLCDVHDCTNEQAAEILNLNLNTLKSHLSRGRKKLRVLLAEEAN